MVLGALHIAPMRFAVGWDALHRTFCQHTQSEAASVFVHDQLVFDLIESRYSCTFSGMHLTFGGMHLTFGTSHSAACTSFGGMHLGRCRPAPLAAIARAACVARHTGILRQASAARPSLVWHQTLGNLLKHDCACLDYTHRNNKTALLDRGRNPHVPLRK